MIVEYDFSKDDLIEYHFIKTKSKRINLIGGLLVSIIFCVIGIGLILMSFVVQNYNFLCLAFGISFIVFSFQKSDLRKNIKNDFDKLERQGKLNHYFGKIRLEVQDDTLLLSDKVSELKILGTAITDLGIKGNCIVIEFGLNSLLIPIRNFKVGQEMNEFLEKIKSATNLSTRSSIKITGK